MNAIATRRLVFLVPSAKEKQEPHWKYIGACAAVLDGVDVIVFTAGIGSNSPVIRLMICDGLDFPGSR